jgi:hypothetical protein
VTASSHSAANTGPSTPGPKYAGWAALVGLLLTACLIYGRYLPKDHFTASGDFPPAVSYALNYRLAVADGQWLPRLIVIPRDVSLGLGSIDGTVPTADAPDFQYYAFLQSALAYPLLRLGVPGIKAVQLVVVLGFALAGMLLYAAGRIMGARPGVSFLAGFSYVLSPWLVSNFYGRGGISEALGQASLPWLLLGFACVCRERLCLGILTTAAGIAALALSHNIFLLYGALLCAVLGGSLLLVPVSSPPPGNRGWNRLRPTAALAAGAGLGLAVTAWQWLPAVQTLGEISFQYFGAFGEAGRIPKGYADWSGALGLPRQFVEPWSGTPREFFFTIGWWTIPGVLLLAHGPRQNRPAALAVALGFTAFVLLIVFPRQIYPHLPGPFGATQFTFRLLAYLSVLGSFALCLAQPVLNRWVVLVVGCLVAWSQLRVINFPMPAGGGITALHEEQYVRGSEYNAFYANSPAERKLRYYPDGFLQPDNTLNLHQRFWHRLGKDLVEETTRPGTKPVPVFVRLKGRVSSSLSQTRLRLVQAAHPAVTVSEPVEVNGDDFTVTLMTADVGEDLRLVAEPSETKGKRTISIQPREVFVMWGHPDSLIPAAGLRLMEHHGYRRVFRLEASAQAAGHPDHTGRFTLEIPMIYSRFLTVWQNGRPLDTAVDFNHRLNVITDDLTGDITVEFRVPALAWWLSGVGLAGLVVVMLSATRPGTRLLLGGRKPAAS